MNFFKKANVFTILMALAVFAFAFRLVDIAQFPTPESIARTEPSAQKFEPVPVSAPAPAQTAAAGSPAADAPAAPGSVPPLPPPPYGEHAFSAAEIEVLQSLSKRRDELDKRAQQIGRQEALLKAAESEVDRKIAELNKIRSALEDLLNRQKTAEDERVNSLVKIYENMKPKEAARIFDTLEMEVLLSVISRMAERKTSPILANMDPERARQVTIQLAEQRRLPPPAAVPAAPILTLPPMPPLTP